MKIQPITYSLLYKWRNSAFGATQRTKNKSQRISYKKPMPCTYAGSLILLFTVLVSTGCGGGPGGQDDNGQMPNDDVVVIEPGEDTVPASGKDSYVPDPELLFTPARGLFDSATSVQLSTSIAGANIYYTLDGSKPAANNGTLYTSPIAVDTTATVRAVVIDADEEVTDVATHTYIFPKDVLKQSDNTLPSGDYVFWTNEMDPNIVNDNAYSAMIEGAFYAIPTMSIVAPDAAIFGVAGIHRGNNLRPEDAKPHPDHVDEVEVSLEMFYPANYSRPHGPGFQSNVGLKIQGGGGKWDNGEYDHKQSFGLRFRKAYGNGSLNYTVFEDAPLNGASESGKYDKLILRAGHNKSWGSTWDNDRSVYTRDQLGRDLQIDMSGVGVRGTFVHLYINGLYWGLYNPTERPDDAHASNYLGGKEDEHYVGKGKGGDVDGDSERFDFWRDTVSDSGDWAQLQDYLAIDEYIDMALSNVYAATGDFPQYYFTNRFGDKPGPIYFWNWDIEDSFGGGSRRSGDPDANRLGKVYEFDTIWDNFPEFRQRFTARANAHVAANGALSDANVLANWNALTHYIEDAIVLESARWGDERIDDTNERYTRDDQWTDARDAVTDDIQGRAAKLIEALKDDGYY